jgi:hypothetical protein
MLSPPSRGKGPQRPKGYWIPGRTAVCSIRCSIHLWFLEHGVAMKVTSLLKLVAGAGLVVALGGIPSGSVSAVDAQAAPQVVRTWTVTHGLRISMLFPRFGVMPRAALLPARVRITNVSGHELILARPCDRANPRAVVANERGHVVYTTIRTFPVPQQCVRRPAFKLAPGQSIERRNYVVLRGPVVEPAIYLMEGDRTVLVQGKGYRAPMTWTYRTPRAMVSFVGGGHLVLTYGGGNVPLYQRRRIASFRVEATGPVYGPLVMIGGAQCAGRIVRFPRWTVISRSRSSAQIPLPCSRPRAWSFLYGWVGRSMSEVLVGVGNLAPRLGSHP